MGARKNRGVGKLPDEWKERIKSAIIVDRLQKHINGEVELTNTQVSAAKILLGKTIPDIARTEHTGRDGGAIETKDITRTDADILAQYLKK